MWFFVHNMSFLCVVFYRSLFVIFLSIIVLSPIHGFLLTLLVSSNSSLYIIVLSVL